MRDVGNPGFHLSHSFTLTRGKWCSFSFHTVLPRFSSGVWSNLCWSERESDRERERSEREWEKGGDDDDSDSQRLWRHISVVCGKIGKLALCSSLRRGCCVQASRVFQVVGYTICYKRRRVPSLPSPRRLQRHSALRHTLSGFSSQQAIKDESKRKKRNAYNQKCEKFSEGVCHFVIFTLW